MALGCCLSNKYSAGESSESDDNNWERVNEGEEGSCDGAGDGASDSSAKTDPGDQVSGEGCDDETDEVGEEEGTERSDGKRKRRGAEVKSYPGEDADQREEHIEADGESGDEATVAKHCPDLMREVG